METNRSYARQKQNFVKTQLAATHVIVSLDTKTRPLATAQVGLCLIILSARNNRLLTVFEFFWGLCETIAYVSQHVTETMLVVFII